jgi:Bacterial proteasome activator
MEKHYEARTTAHVDTPGRDPPGRCEAPPMREDGQMSEPQEQRVVVVGPDGQPIGQMSARAEATRGQSDEDGSDLSGMVEQPAKVMRIGTMIKQLLEEVRAAPLDEASRVRLREIHQSSIRELEEGLSPELHDELERLTLPFTDDATPSDAELRIAQAQLVGWLEGLFHGIQTALFAQQMAARAQLEEMRRRALPGPHGMPGQQGPLQPGSSTGQYL